MKTYKCDLCDSDITYTTNSVDYRIILKSEKIPTNPNYTITDMGIRNPIEGEHCFCSIACLDKFVSELR